MFFSYILKSLKDGRYYYGSTKDVNERLVRHNKGDVKATKHRRPLIVHYFEKHAIEVMPLKEKCFISLLKDIST